MPARPWVPPATFNFIATLIAFGGAIALAWMAWNYYEYTPRTRDGRVGSTIQVAPEVSGTVFLLPVKGTQFVHKGDVLFQVDPRTYENKLKQVTGRLAQAKAQASYLEAEAMRRSQLPDLAVSAEQRQASPRPPTMRCWKQPALSNRRGSTWSAPPSVQP